VGRELHQLQRRNQTPMSSIDDADLSWLAAWQLWRQKPLLAWFSRAMGGLPLDALHDTAALFGAMLAALAALRFCQHGILFALLFVLYLGLYNAGGTFFSFQWYDVVVNFFAPSYTSIFRIVSAWLVLESFFFL
jgi:hypothetical protein